MLTHGKNSNDQLQSKHTSIQVLQEVECAFQGSVSGIQVFT